MKTDWLTGAAIASLAIATTTCGDTLDLVHAAIANGISSQDVDEETPSEPVEQSGFYLGGGVGVNLMSDITVNGTANNLKMAAGVDSSVSVGYQFVEWFSVEAESGVVWNEGRDLPPGLSMNLYQVPIMANANFTIPLSRPGSQRWPFIGVTAYLDFKVGIGTEWTRFNWKASGNKTNTSDWAFAYQVGTDLRLGLTSNFDLGVYFRFRGTTKVAMSNQVIAGVGGIDAKELLNYALGMNFRVTF